METLQLDTKQFTDNEKQLLVLLYFCPIGESIRECVLYHIRKISNNNIIKTVESFGTNEIIELITDHKKCLFKRVSDCNLKLIPKTIQQLNCRISFLIWTGKGNLVFLISEIIKRKWIKSQNNFAELFGEGDKNLKIFWEVQYKYELAYLLYKLKKESYFRTVNSKGYFRIAEGLIIDYSKNIFKNNALKQISSKITLNPEKHIDIIESVDNVIRSMRLNANRL